MNEIKNKIYEATVVTAVVVMGTAIAVSVALTRKGTNHDRPRYQKSLCR